MRTSSRPPSARGSPPKLLREKLGVTGVVVTDASPVVGLTGAAKRSDILPMAMEVGCDLFLLFSVPDEGCARMMTGWKSGKLSGERLHDALARILSLKAMLGLPESKQVTKDGADAYSGTSSISDLTDSYGLVISVANVVGIDSEGWVKDAMDVTHRECLTPSYIEYFNLQAAATLVRQTALFVNLYSTSRGQNRWVALSRSSTCCAVARRCWSARLRCLRARGQRADRVPVRGRPSRRCSRASIA